MSYLAGERKRAVVIAEAIDYPGAGDRSWRTLAVGGVLSALWVLVGPLIPVLGYQMRVLAGTMENLPAPPRFDDPRHLVSSGTGALGIVAVAMVGPAIVATLAWNSVGAPRYSVGSDVVFAEQTIRFFGVGVLATLVVWLVVPAALANYVRTGRLSGAVSGSALAAALGSPAYLRSWLVGIALLAGAFLAQIALFVVFVFAPVEAYPWEYGAAVAWVLSGVVWFFAWTAAFRAWGRGFVAAVDARGRATGR